MEIFEEVVRLRRQGRASALATIVECQGSSPQKQGAKMLVRDDGSIMGTLGGGCLEADVVQGALMSMKDGSPMTLPFELTERKGGLVCGGKVIVFIEPVLIEPRIVILGAGHVGRALSTLARFSGFNITVVDDRPEFANKDNIPDANEIIVHDFPSVFSRVRVEKTTFIVVATRGHNHDIEAVKAALGTDAGYIGLMGSRRKKGLLMNALRDAGFSQEDIGRVIIPVGITINSVTPQEIAVSIMAQIIQRRRENGALRSGPAACGRLVQEDGKAETAASAWR